MHTIVTVTTTEPTSAGDRAYTIAVPVARHSAPAGAALGALADLIGVRWPMLHSVNARITAAAAIALGVGGV